MRYVIEHEVPGRLRLTFADHLDASDALALETSLSSWTGVERVRSYPRIRSVAIWYRDALARTALLDRLNELSRVQLDAARAQAPTALAPAVPSAARSIIRLVGNHLIRRWLLPPALRAVWAGLHYLGFLRAGLTSLMRHRLDVPVLDATAIGLSFVKRDPKTAASTMFLLDLGEVLEDATRERSEHELIRSLMAIPQNARRLEDGEEVTVPAQSLRAGDLVVARAGMPVCVDGVVVRGAAMVNQAALTGEPLAVERMAGDDVFAGTAVEEGEIVIRVGAEPASTKLRSIVNLVEASEQLKSEIQTRREHLADRFVPWNFLLAGLVAATTKSLAKTSAALMVDYSCALRLTSSISVLAAMSQSAHEGMAVKGAKHFARVPSISRPSPPPTPSCSIRRERSPRRRPGSRAYSPSRPIGPRTRSCAPRPVWRSTSPTPWHAPWWRRPPHAVSSIASATPRSPISWRTASRRRSMARESSSEAATS